MFPYNDSMSDSQCLLVNCHQHSRAEVQIDSIQQRRGVSANLRPYSPYGIVYGSGGSAGAKFVLAQGSASNWYSTRYCIIECAERQPLSTLSIYSCDMWNFASSRSLLNTMEYAQPKWNTRSVLCSPWPCRILALFTSASLPSFEDWSVSKGKFWLVR